MEFRGERGSFTVEAAWLLPVILAVAFAVLSLAMVQHDKAVTLSALDTCLLRAEYRITMGTDPESGQIDYERRLSRSLAAPLTGRRAAEEELERYLEEAFDAQFRFLVEIDGIEVEAGLTRLKVTLYPALRGGWLAGLLLPEASWSKSVRVLHPEEMVRAFGGRAGAEVPEEEELEEELREAAEMEEGGEHP